MNPLIQFKKICLVCVAVLACYGLSPALNANTINVTNTNDSGPGSLREALAVAINGDTIDARGISGRILLTSGALQINSLTNNNVRIIGPGARHLAIDGNAISRVFKNLATGVSISGFTITNGNGGSAGGGGIFNQGGLTLSNNGVVSNTGGGIFNQGRLTLSNSRVVSNTGNGIYNITANGVATLRVISCTVSGNSGSGISNIGAQFTPLFPSVTVSNCTISGNSGSGISNFCSADTGTVEAALTVSNCTISGNMASNGGAIYNAATEVEGNAFAMVAISNSTLSGGGIYNNGHAGVRPGIAEVELDNTILDAGSSGFHVVNNFGTITSHGYNLSSVHLGFLRGPGDQINNPMLGPLQNNGGPTFTHALLPGSPAINRGNPNFTPPPSFDQRGPGHPRVVNGRIDIGSFEVQVTPTPTPTPP